MENDDALGPARQFIDDNLADLADELVRIDSGYSPQDANLFRGLMDYLARHRLDDYAPSRAWRLVAEACIRKVAEGAE